MEFFIKSDLFLNQQEIQDQISIEEIDQFCDSIFLLKHSEETAHVATSWGEFDLSRQEITGGVRFALTSCPNALAWTITSGYPPDPEKIVIHLTINRTEKSEEFVQSVIDFGHEWRQGLESVFS